jgi:hypothetical protein
MVATVAYPPEEHRGTVTRHNLTEARTVRAPIFAYLLAP